MYDDILIRGVDFTSRPQADHPQIAAEARLYGDRLHILWLRELSSWSQLEDWLAEPGPWIAGFDFPFGQPRRLIEDLGWAPGDWPSLVARVAEMGRRGWLERLAAYRRERPDGEEEHGRLTDRVAAARPALKERNPPLAAMFFEGAQRLLAADVSVLPCHPRPDEDRRVVETYPALVARAVLAASGFSGTGYKGRTSSSAWRHRRRRQTLVAALGAPKITRPYGLSVIVPRSLTHQLEHDGSGDRLDAVLATLQAAWAWHRHRTGFGIPADVDPLEGWIVDPATTLQGDRIQPS